MAKTDTGKVSTSEVLKLLFYSGFDEDFVTNFILILNIHMSYHGRLTLIKMVHLYHKTSQ